MTKIDIHCQQWLFMRIIKQTLKEYASFSQEMELNQHHKQHLLEKKKASLKIVNQTPPWETDF